MVVELGQPGVDRVVVGEPDVLIETETTRCLQNAVRQDRQPARIDPLGLEILVDQRLKLLERAVDLGAGEGRGEMVDDGGRDPALGLAAFAGIVDDERVEHRQRAEHGFGIAVFRERQSLARKPFQIAVLADEHHGMSVEHLPDPGVKGQIGVRRDQIRVVIGRLRVNVVAARRLDPDGDIPEPVQRQPEGVGPHAPVLVRGSPAGGHLRGSARIGGEVQAFATRPFQTAGGIGRPSEQMVHQGRAALRCAGGVVALLPKCSEDVDGRGRGVQAHAVAKPAFLGRIVGQHQGDPPLGRRGGAQAGERGGLVGHKVDPVGDWFRADDRALGGIVEHPVALEGYGPSQQPPVDLRESHMHGDIPGAQALCSCLPDRPRAARQHGLQDRAIRDGKRPAARIPRFRHRERSAIEDDRRLGGGQGFTQQCG